MGDIARHRDIFLNTRESLPPDLLRRCKFAEGDLTYLELGNYFTDVSQFRDPVFYFYAKHTIWRENILPGVNDNTIAQLAKAGTALLAAGLSAAAFAALEGKWKALGLIPGAALPALAAGNNNINDMLAGWQGVDDWLDGMLGKPIDQLDAQGKRDPKAFGFLGRFFQHFIEGTTHMIFSDGITKGSSGGWAQITKIPQADLTATFTRSFTQYFPHEHTDQPPYVWDASKRPGKPMYEPGPRGKKQGVMNVVYEHYIGYLAEALCKLEHAWQSIPKDDQNARRMWLVDLGKIVHGVEDWYFHSNIVELLRLHTHAPAGVADPEREAFVKRTILAELSTEPEYQRPEANRKRLQRFFFRRLRFPVYSSGTGENTGGIASETTSILNWDHAYPAFPSTLDTAHTLMGALETIESKFRPSGSGSNPLAEAPWATCILRKFHGAGPEWRAIYEERAKARGIILDPHGIPTNLGLHNKPLAKAFALDLLREYVPLVVTLLFERERQRLVADVDPMQMPLDGSEPRPKQGVTPGKGQTEKQIARHVAALKPKLDAQGHTENNYARAARYFAECGFLNAAGQAAIEKAFEVDIESETKKVNDQTPGAGGFLIEFGVKMQKQIDAAEAGTALSDRKDPFTNIATSNGSDNEVIGSHSLMSKDTTESSPFFDDARVLASLASQSVVRLLMEEVSAPGPDRINWQSILRHFIRFPLANGGWERRAMALFKQNGRGPIPSYDDHPELANLKQARMPEAEAEKWRNGKRAEKLRQLYVDLEKKLADYRNP